MAHVNIYPDFTDHIQNNGSILVSVKATLVKVFRALAGKTVLAGNSTAFAATVVVPVTGLSFRVRAGRQYRVTGKILATNNGTSGIKLGFSLNGSSAATGTIVYKYLSAASLAVQAVASNALAANSTGIAAVCPEVDIDGYFIPDVSGLVNLSAGTFTGTTAGSIDVGSSMAVYRVRG